mmetsp:Transcript_51546/g.122753  ORF Transcript_51546/g.122753 Transcript_51546/m.122753 type:complete len:205 (-) Transcript_51546:232-846(-)
MDRHRWGEFALVAACRDSDRRQALRHGDGIRAALLRHARRLHAFQLFRTAGSSELEFGGNRGLQTRGGRRAFRLQLPLRIAHRMAQRADGGDESGLVRGMSQHAHAACGPTKTRDTGRRGSSLRTRRRMGNRAGRAVGREDAGHVPLHLRPRGRKHAGARLHHREALRGAGGRSDPRVSRRAKLAGVFPGRECCHRRWRVRRAA